MFKQKYKKYKQKYLTLKFQYGGGYEWSYEDSEEKIPSDIQTLLEEEYQTWLSLGKPKKYSNRNISFPKWTYGEKIISRLETHDKVSSTRTVQASEASQASQTSQTSVDRFYNRAIASFGIEIILNALHAFLSAYPQKKQVSVGSGNGILEHSYATRYTSSTETIICVDPSPLEYQSKHLERAFQSPKYNLVSELVRKEPDCINNCVLILNWAYPNESTYDYEAIMSLRPLAFFTTIERYRNTGAAGGARFHNFLRTTTDYILVHRIRLDGSDQDICVEWWQKVELPPIKTTLPLTVRSLQKNEEPSDSSLFLSMMQYMNHMKH